MSLLVENVRHLRNERSNILVDTGTYSSGSTTLTLLKDYGNITLSVAGFLLWHIDVWVGGSITGYFKLTIGGLEVFGCSTTATSNSTVGRNCLIYLPAGTYDIKVYGCVSSVIYNCFVQNFYASVVSFSDQDNSTQPTTYSGVVNFTLATRVTCLGPLNHVLPKIQVFAYTPSAATSLENIGDNLTNGVSLTINGSQVSWDNRLQDSGARGVCYGDKTFITWAGSANTITLTKRNVNTVVVINIVCCPWILSAWNQCQPVSLSFSQMSTAYVNMAPMVVDETKYVKAGMPRAVSFGDATDYYSTLSGTGFLSWSYTFTITQVGDCNLFLYTTTYGYTCIESIGVDAR